MSSILIAEDEQIELNFLKTVIRNKIEEINEIYLASNGKEAIDLYKQYLPDIVFLDVNMPIYNGLEVAKFIRNTEKKKTKIFILTSYNYFQYAQEAISLSVEEFLLKPLEIHILIKKLTQAIETLKIENNYQIETNNLLDSYNSLLPMLEERCVMTIISCLSNEDEILKQMNALHIYFKSGCCFLINISNNTKTSTLLKLTKEKVEDLGYSLISYIINDYCIIYTLAGFLMQEENQQMLFNVLSNIFNQNKIFTGIMITKPNKLYLSYLTAFEKTKHSNNNICSNEYFCSFWVNRLQNELTIGDEKTIQQSIYDFIHAYRRQVSQNGLDKTNIILKIIENLFSYLPISNEEIQTHLKNSNFYLISFDKYIDHADTQILTAISSLMRKWRTIRYENLHYLCKNTIEYIWDSYKKPIGLNDVAQYLNVSSTYLSRVLNKENMGFTDLLNEYRVLIAKQLICNNEILKNVSELAGFRSQSYFTNVFKKTTSISPKEYRQQKRSI